MSRIPTKQQEKETIKVLNRMAKEHSIFGYCDPDTYNEMINRIERKYPSWDKETITAIRATVIRELLTGGLIEV